MPDKKPLAPLPRVRRLDPFYQSREGLPAAPGYIPPGPANLPPRNQRIARTPNNLVAQPDEWKRARARQRAAGQAVVLPDSYRVYDPHHYADPADLAFTLTVASQLLILSPNGLRNYLGIRNSSPGTEIVYVSFDQASSAAGSFLALTAGQMIFYDAVVPQGDIWVNGSAATATVIISHAVIPNA